MEKAILQTLAYADIFDYPLRQEEIWHWLISTDNKQPATYNKKAFEVSLKKLLKVGRCKFWDGYYCLTGREQIVELRKQRERWSVSKIKRAKRIAGILKFLPWVKLIGITGGLAQNNSHKDDDIDLLFITSRQRVWLTRGFTVLILRLLRLYRRPGKIADMICPNMFITEESLRMQPEDLFIAHEVCQLKLIFVKNRTYQRFLKANLWVRKFLPNWKP